MTKKIILKFFIGALLVSYFIYSSPKEIEKTFEGSLVSQDKGAFLKSVSITLKGTSYPSLIRQDRFIGTIEIEGKKYEIRTSEPGPVDSHIVSFKKKWRRESLYASGMIMKDGFLRSLGGTMFIAEDYSRIWGNIQDINDQYDDQSLMFSGPAKTFEEAQRIINDI